MEASIEEAIRAGGLGEMSGGGTSVPSSVVLAGQSCDTDSATVPEDGLVEAIVVTDGMPQNEVAAAATAA